MKNQKQTTEKIISNAKDSGKTVANVPNLRFSNDNSWIRMTLGEICDFLKGNGLSKSDLSGNGQLCILYGQLYTTYTHEVIRVVESHTNAKLDNPVLSIANDVIIPGSGETPEDIATASCVLVDNVLYGGDLNVLRLQNGYDGRFISYELNGKRKYDIARIAQGKSIVHLHNDNLKNLVVYYPKNKVIALTIVSLLEKIDYRIETQIKIIKDLKTYKNLIMDYILGKYFFSEFSLHELIKANYIRIIKPNELAHFEGERKYLSTSSIDEHGIVSVESTITFNCRPSRASMKPIKNSIWFAKMKNSIKVFMSDNNDENEYILSTGFYGVLCDEAKLSRYWIKEVFLSKYFNKQKDRFSEGSSMSGIKDNQLSDIIIKIFKCKSDEERVVKLLNLLSVKIDNEIKILEKYKEQKKFLLSNMFI